MSHKYISVIVQIYPCLTQTFVARELRILQEKGFIVTLFSLNTPHPSDVHTAHVVTELPVVYVSEWFNAPLMRILSLCSRFS